MNMINMIIIILFNIFLLPKFNFLQTFYISNDSNSCPTCDGSLINPFHGFIQGINQATIISNQKNDSSIEFILVSQQYFITQSDLPIQNEENLFIKSISKNAFDFLSFNYIKCNGVINCSEKAIIYLKTSNFSILIGKNTTLKNIKFRGEDLAYLHKIEFDKEINQENCYLSKNESCCKENELILETSKCFINTKIDYKIKDFRALFTFSDGNCSFLIENCIFANIIQIYLNSYLAYTSIIISTNFNNSIKILKSIFINNSLDKGIIDDRNSFYYIELNEIQIINYNFINLKINYLFAFSLNSQEIILKNSFISNTKYAFTLHNKTNFLCNNTSYIIEKNLDNEDGIRFININFWSKITLVNLSISVTNTGEKKDYEERYLFYNYDLGIKSNYIVILAFDNNTITLLDSNFNNINGVRLLSVGNFSIIDLNNLKFIDMKITSSYMLLFYSNNDILITDLSIENTASDYRPFIAAFRNNTIISKNILLNSTEELFVFYLNTKNNLYIYDSLLTNITVDDFPSLVFLLKENNLNISNVKFDNIKANSEYSSRGACIQPYVNNIVYIIDNTFNEIGAVKGAICLVNNNTLKIFNSIFEESFSSANEGIIDATDKNNSIIIYFCQFIKIIEVCIRSNMEGHIEIFNSVFDSGSGSGNLGVISFEMANIIISYSLFTNFVSSNSQGIIAMTQFNKLILSYCYFMDNSLNIAIVFNLNKNNTANIENSFFRNNSAIKQGGIMAIQILNIIEIKNSIFLETKSENGGFIYLQNDNKFSYFNNTMNNSESKFYGGFMFSEERNEISLIDSEFYNTNSEIKGGFIYSKSNSTILLINSKIENSRSNSGGCFNLLNFNKLKIQNSNITNITSSTYGGFIYGYMLNSINLTNITVINPKSEYKGGFFYLDIGNLLYLIEFFIENPFVINSGALGLTVLNNSLEIKNGKILNPTNKGGKDSLLVEFGTRTNVIVENLIIIEMINNGLTNGFWLFNNNNVTINNLTIENTNMDSYINYLFFLTEYNFLKISNSKFFTSRTNYSNLGLFSLNLNDNLMIFNSDFFCSDFCYQKFAIVQQNSKIILESLIINNTNSFNEFFFITQKSLLEMSNIGLFILYQPIILVSNSTIKFIKMKIRFEFNKNNEVMGRFLNADNNGEVFLINMEIQNLKKAYLFAFLESTVLMIINSNIIGFNLGFIDGRKMKKCKVIGSSFEWNKGDKAGIIYIEQNEGNFTIKNNIFTNNFGISKGGALSLKSLNRNSIIIIRNRIHKNTGLLGGGIYIEDYKQIHLESNIFDRNSAFGKNRIDSNFKFKGGALFIISEINRSTIINKMNLFQYNKAKIGGAIYFQPYNIYYTEENTIFKSNMANYYGESIATSIKNLVFIESKNQSDGSIIYTNPSSSLEITVASGRYYNDFPAIIAGLDKFNSVMVQEEFNYQLNLKMKTPTDYTNNIEYIMNKGMLCFSTFTRLQAPIESSFIYNIWLDYPLVSDNLTLNVNFRNCLVGEKLSSKFTCEECPFGRYSLEQDFFEASDNCFQCKGSEFTCEGGTNLLPLPGYWRYSVESSKFLACTQKSHCLGGKIFLNSIQDRADSFSEIFTKLDKIGTTKTSQTGFCAKGYKGVLCNECIETWGKINSYTCLPCRTNGYVIWIVFQIIIKLSILFISLHIALQTSVKIFSGDISIRFLKLTCLIKILLMHIQILRLLFAFIDFKDIFNDAISFSLGFTSNVSESFNIECLIKYYELDIKPLHFQFFITIFYLIPFLLITSIYVFFFIRAQRESLLKSAIIKKLKYFSIFMANFLILIELCYFDVITVSFKMFSNINVQDEHSPENRLLFDYSINLEEEFHKDLQIFAYFVIFCFGLGFPLFIFFMLYTRYKAGELNNDFSRLQLSYFYFPYEEKYFFWDVLHILEKFIAVSIQILLASRNQVENSVTLQILLIFMLFVLYLQIRLRPYKQKELNVLNRLEQFSLISCCISIYLVLLYNTIIADEYNIDVGIQSFLFTIALSINVFFGFFWFSIYIPEKKKELMEDLKEIKAKVVKLMSKKKIESKNTLASTNQNLEQILKNKKSKDKLDQPNISLVLDKDYQEYDMVPAHSHQSIDLEHGFQEINVIYRLNEKLIAPALLKKNISFFNLSENSLIKMENEFLEKEKNKGKFYLYSSRKEDEIKLEDNEYYTAFWKKESIEETTMILKCKLSLKWKKHLKINKIKVKAEDNVLIKGSIEDSLEEDSNDFDFIMIAGFKEFSFATLPYIFIDANDLVQNYEFIIRFPLSVNSFIKFHYEYNAEKFNKYWKTICNFYIFKNNYCDDNVSIDSLQFYLTNSFKNKEKTEILGVLSHFMLNETLFFYKIKIIKRKIIVIYGADGNLINKHFHYNFLKVININLFGFLKDLNSSIKKENND